MFGDLNLYTWGGIIGICLTYYLIQKGASISATKNKTEIENRISIAEKNAIKEIENSRDSTKNKIEKSAELIMSDLKAKAKSLNKSLDILQKEADKATAQIKKKN